MNPSRTWSRANRTAVSEWKPGVHRSRFCVVSDTTHEPGSRPPTKTFRTNLLRVLPSYASFLMTCPTTTIRPVPKIEKETIIYLRSSSSPKFSKEEIDELRRRLDNKYHKSLRDLVMTMKWNKTYQNKTCTCIMLAVSGGKGVTNELWRVRCVTSRPLLWPMLLFTLGNWVTADGGMRAAWCVNGTAVMKPARLARELMKHTATRN